MPDKFWETKTLEEMTHAEWESLCDGCGRCCLLKLEDEDTGRIHYTSIACRLFDEASCRCSDYARRTQEVGDCLALTPQSVRTLTWLPKTCAYRLLAEGKPLYDWHPLLSGRAQSVVEAGISVRGRLSGHEGAVTEEETVHHIVRWPERAHRHGKRSR